MIMTILMNMTKRSYLNSKKKTNMKINMKLMVTGMMMTMKITMMMVMRFWHLKSLNLKP